MRKCTNLQKPWRWEILEYPGKIVQCATVWLDFFHTSFTFKGNMVFQSVEM